MASKIQQVFLQNLAQDGQCWWLNIPKTERLVSKVTLLCLRCRKVLCSLEVAIDSGIQHDSKESKQKPNQWKDFFWNYWGRCCVSSMLFKLIRCNSETSRSLGSQQRGRQSLKIWDEFLKMLFKQLIQLFLKQAITAYYCAFQVNRPKEKRNPPHIFFFFV